MGDREIVDNIIYELGKPQDFKHIKAAWKVVWKLCVLNFLMFAITFSIYPNFCFTLNLGTQEAWKYPLVVLIYSCADFSGKVLNSLIAIKDGAFF